MSCPVSVGAAFVQRLKRNITLAVTLPGVHVRRFVVAAARRGGGGATCRSVGALGTTAAFAGAAVATRFEELEVVHNNHMFGPLLPALLVVPLLQDQVPFEKHLMALPQTLLSEVGLPAILPAVEHLDVDEHRVVFPLS